MYFYLSINLKEELNMHRKYKINIVRNVVFFPKHSRHNICICLIFKNKSKLSNTQVFPSPEAYYEGDREVWIIFDLDPIAMVVCSCLTIDSKESSF